MGPSEGIQPFGITLEKQELFSMQPQGPGKIAVTLE
jgi:hypothetical protein